MTEDLCLCSVANIARALQLFWRSYRVTAFGMQK